VKKLISFREPYNSIRKKGRKAEKTVQKRKGLTLLRSEKQGISLRSTLESRPLTRRKKKNVDKGRKATIRKSHLSRKREGDTE